MSMSSDPSTATATQVKEGFDADNFDNASDPSKNQDCPRPDYPFIDAFGYKWWINYHWNPKTGTYVYGNNGIFRSIFDPKIINKTDDGIQLQVIRGNKEQDDSKTSELVLGTILGYGNYLVTARCDNSNWASLDWRAVFGAFTYQWGEAAAGPCRNLNREIDALETISNQAQKRLGNAQFTLQPADAQVINRFTIPPDCKTITVMMVWKPGKVFFAAYNGDFSLNDIKEGKANLSHIHSWDNSDRTYVPAHTDSSKERFHINFWLYQGFRPAQNQSVTVTRFEFSE